MENNASLKATTKNGFTPLHIAAKYGNMSVANILLQRDSKLDAQGKVCTNYNIFQIFHFLILYLYQNYLQFNSINLILIILFIYYFF